VSFDSEGHPELRFPDTAPPAETAEVVLKPGEGAVVAEDDLVTMHYQLTHWESGAVIFDSWDKGTIEFRADDDAISRVRDGVVGQKVGSVLMLVLPPDEDAESNELAPAGIAADDTIVIVIELVDAKK
jgi:FKBP-type peptidyl-prolyl cis-trans isomerase